MQPLAPQALDPRTLAAWYQCLQCLHCKTPLTGEDTTLHLFQPAWLIRCLIHRLNPVTWAAPLPVMVHKTRTESEGSRFQLGPRVC